MTFSNRYNGFWYNIGILSFRILSIGIFFVKIDDSIGILSLMNLYATMLWLLLGQLNSWDWFSPLIQVLLALWVEMACSVSRKNTPGWERIWLREDLVERGLGRQRIWPRDDLVEGGLDWERTRLREDLAKRWSGRGRTWLREVLVAGGPSQEKTWPSEDLGQGRI